MAKILLLVFGLMIVLTSCGQYAKFETTIHKENATKDGIYLDKYIVNLTYDEILSLDRKKVIVKGRYVIVKGLDPKDAMTKQGRLADTKHILHPKIKIIGAK